VNARAERQARPAAPPRISFFRGLFRIWVVLTILWIAGVGVYMYLNPDPHFFYLGTPAAEGQTMMDGIIALAGTALLPPLAILVVGMIVAWIGRGFVPMPRDGRTR
jgi:hypothetical protein